MVAMRFRENDYEAIKKKADKANLNFTEFVTKSALDKSIVVINGLGDVLKEQKAIGRNLQEPEPAEVQKNSVRCIHGTHNDNHPFGFHARLSWVNSQYEVFQRKAQNLRRPFSE